MHTDAGAVVGAAIAVPVEVTFVGNAVAIAVVV
jgi:hypothetical protein